MFYYLQLATAGERTLRKQKQGNDTYYFARCLTDDPRKFQPVKREWVLDNIRFMLNGEYQGRKLYAISEVAKISKMTRKEKEDLLEISGDFLAYFPPEDIEDISLALIAVSNDKGGFVFRNLSEKLRDNERVLQATMKTHPENIRWASDRLKKKYNFQG